MAVKKFTGGVPGSEGDVSVAANWEPSGVPTGAADTILFTVGSTDVTEGLAALAAVEIVKMIVEPGAGSIGTPETYFNSGQIGSLEFNGTGAAYIDVGTDSPTVLVRGTGASITGGPGLTLKNSTSALGTLSVLGGSVDIGDGIQHHAIISKLFQQGGYVSINAGSTWSGSAAYDIDVGGSGVCDAHVIGAGIVINVAQAGRVTTHGTDVCGGIIIRGGGAVVANSTGTISALSLYDQSTIDFLQTGATRTITAASFWGGTLFIDDEFVTITTFSTLNGRRQVTYAAP